jgi:hypothetical protein
MVNYCLCLWSSEDGKLLFVSGALKLVTYCLCLWSSKDGKLLFVSVGL